MSARSLVIKVTAGKEYPERCNQGFNVAAAAVASGITTSLWLTGEASWFALPGRAEEFTLPAASGVVAGGSLMGVALVFWTNGGGILSKLFGIHDQVDLRPTHHRSQVRVRLYELDVVRVLAHGSWYR